jgi:hypothetical protein
MIIVPLTTLSFTSRSTKPLKKLFNDLIGSPIKILKKKEKDILNNLSITLDDVKIKRSFNILINDVSINIVKMHDVESNEQENINNYLKDVMTHTSNYKQTMIDGFIFEYNITF